MRNALIGLAVGMLLSAPSVFALRTARPPEFYEWNSNTFSQLNDALLQFFNVLNGRYSFDVMTTDPDGTRRGTAGDAVIYNNAGTLVFCVNTNDATDWDCATLVD